MRKVVWFLVITAMVLMLRSALAAEPYLTLKVDHGDGSYAIVNGYLDHLSDLVWVQEADYLSRPQIAWDYGGVKYGHLSLGYPAYIWAGNHMVDGTSYDLIVQTTGLVKITGKKPDGTTLFDQTVSSGQIFNWTLEVIHATTAQWHTRGYRLDVTPVPEPSSIVVLVGAVLPIGFCRRKH